MAELFNGIACSPRFQPSLYFFFFFVAYTTYTVHVVVTARAFVPFQLVRFLLKKIELHYY